MANIAHQMERLLPHDALTALRQAGQLAAGPDSHARELYLVGGPVRDIFLGVAPRDLDFSVAGDGEAFARALAAHLGGHVSARSEFGTARLEVKSLVIDVATARYERYASPGTLPIVTPAGIHEDLARRDFTVNAMAVSLMPDHWGDLLDPCAGQADIVRGVVRVLRDRSFQDDPTRIFRAVRYSARLGFVLETSTQAHLVRDLEFIDRLSPARVTAELHKLLLEPRRAAAFKLADELGVLAAVHPSLRTSMAVLHPLEKGEPSVDPVLYHLALLTSTLAPHDASALIARLTPPSDWREVIDAVPRLASIAPLLEQREITGSEIVRLLDAIPLPVVEAQRDIAPMTRRKERLATYLTTLRHVHPALTGDDLIAAGVPQGPLVGKLLGELRDALLDGKLHSKDDEAAYVRRRLPELTRTN